MVQLQDTALLWHMHSLGMQASKTDAVSVLHLIALKSNFTGNLTICPSCHRVLSFTPQILKGLGTC